MTDLDTATRHSGFTAAADALAYIFGGNARVTLTSAVSGDHYTYRVAQKTNDDGSVTPFFISVLTGPDNWANYSYIGIVPDGDRTHLVPGKKGKPGTPSFVAFGWALKHLVAGAIPESLTIQHEGRCCRCARLLTHPDSIALGIGPECASKGV